MATAPYLFTSFGAAITTAAVGTVFTHSFSATAGNVWVIVNQTSVASTSNTITISTSGVNSVTLQAGAAGTTANVACVQFHSIQGGP